MPLDKGVHKTSPGIGHQNLVFLLDLDHCS
jgi:hypothetical protein